MRKLSALNVDNSMKDLKKIKNIGEESAFPNEGGAYKAGEGGLNKLEYFSGLIMQGICNKYTFHREEYFAKREMRDLAERSVALAKALITELTKEDEDA